MDPYAHTRLPGPLFRALRAARDGVADAVAGAAVRSPRVERAVCAACRAYGDGAVGRLVRRRVSDSLVRSWSARGETFRAVRVGPYSVVGDVSHFTFHATHFGGGYEARTTALLLRVLPSGGVFVDVGANAGYFSALAALHAGPGARIAAFEPNPAAAAALRETLRRNGVAARVAVHAEALSDVDAEAVPFYVSRVAGNDGLSSLDPAADAARALERTTVRATRFDRWARAAGFPRADLVKIDVEGAEDRVLRGMARTLEEAPPRHVVCETTAAGEAHALLNAARYAAAPLEVDDGGTGNWLFTHGG